MSILQIESATTTDELQQLLSKDDFLFCLDSGYTKPSTLVTIHDKEELIQMVALDYLLYKSEAETNELMEGLKTAGVLGLLRKNQLQMCPLFCGGHQLEPLTAYTVADLFAPQYSESGSNVREVEESLMFNFEMLLQKAEGGGKLPYVHDYRKEPNVPMNTFHYMNIITIN